MDVNTKERATALEIADSFFVFITAKRRDALRQLIGQASLVESLECRIKLLEPQVKDASDLFVRNAFLENRVAVLEAAIKQGREVLGSV